jgi:hypothetical protein
VDVRDRCGRGVGVSDGCDRDMKVSVGCGRGVGVCGKVVEVTRSNTSTVSTYIQGV